MLSFLMSSANPGAAAVAPPPPFQNPSRVPRRFGDHGSTIVYAVLGDSTAAGRGADYERGIAVRTATDLAGRHRVTMTNFAVSGARARDVLVDQVPGAERLKPDVVLISMGANDVIHLTAIRSVRTDLRAIVRRLRAANAAVAIVITGSPDMRNPPRIPRLLRPIAGWRAAQINRMFMAEADAEHLTFAPIARETGPLFRDDKSLFDSDAFHPNDRGYATWIPTLDRALSDALREF
jgi:lysophospholipase L1-like esterase